MIVARFACALLLSAVPLIAQGSAFDPARAAAFDKGLIEVHDAMARGKWDKAREGIDALLAAHKGQVYVQAQSAGIANDYRTCCFYQEYPKPKAKDLLTGDIASFQEKSGKIKITYSDDWRDWKANDNGLHVHPMVFAGSYTITVAGKHYPSDNTSLRVFFDLDPSGDNFYVADFGFEGKNYFLQAVIEAHSGEKKRTIARDKSKAKGGEKFTASVRVSEKVVQLRYRRKTMLKAKRKNAVLGRTAIFRGKWDQITLEGKVEPSWYQSLVDSTLAKQRETFEGRFQVKKKLPAWLFELPETKRTEPNTNSWLPGAEEGLTERAVAIINLMGDPQKHREALEKIRKLPEEHADLVTRLFVEAHLLLALGELDAAEACHQKIATKNRCSLTRMLHARILDQLGKQAEALAELQQAVADDPGRSECYEPLVVALLQQNRPQDAAKCLRDGKLQHGLWKDLAKLDKLLAMVDRGPQFARRYSSTSAHYEVVSDIDQRLCQEACRLLEGSYANLKTQFSWVREKKGTPRFQVFLFSGESGYQDYCKAILGSAVPHTAGLYSPTLKQLLIWNLPQREMMDRTIRHEGFHQFLDRLMPNPPVWLNEGTAEYWETARHEGGSLKGGQVRKDHLATLARSRKSLPSLKDFVYGNRTDFYAHATQRYAHGWALVHFLRESNRGNETRFAKLWQGLRTVGSTRAALDAAFEGVNWEQFEQEFWQHLKSLR